ncbi:MAG: sigma factor [Butyricimonas faecalis]
MLEQDVLLDLLVRKDNRAYQYLYQCYYVALKALASYYVKDNDVAEDLVQDVFISLLESRINLKLQRGSIV